ncbi:proline/glycine betaine ABC transporter permease [Aestuariivirga sp.]|uniref:ABC transporter permease n=1 Tax=Aestuariivirga sp. TaxID=2650926 RepID=UPI0025BF64AC|nr:ABC transporter permease subunit [Aestuariivirga sp.]MCA3555723.1 ABC transporter permease subunit [Aestuariivirga sp.]
MAAPQIVPAPRLSLASVVVAIILLGCAAAWTWPPLQRWPVEWAIPFRDWVTQAFVWFSAAAKPVTRGLSWLLSWPLWLSEALLFRGFPALNLLPLPWVAIVGGTAILGHWAGGRGLAIFCGLSVFYLAIFGLWQDAMQTLSIVLVTVPLAAAFGLGLGLWATRNARVERVLNSVFDVMQATPHMAYLGPVVILFGFGQVPAMLATFGFALPPMARCTILGLRTVPQDVIEAGRMAGCTPGQLLWKVEIPAAEKTLMLGLNQVVMQTLAMVVIASLVGASGLGQKLLFSLQQLQIGKAVEQGVAITLIAIVLDRLTQAYIRKAPEHQATRTGFIARHPHLSLFLLLLATSGAAAAFLQAFAVPPRELTLSYGGPINSAVRWVSKELFPYIKPLRDWLTVWLMLPLRSFYLWLPWPVMLGVLAAIGYHLSGWRLALLPVCLFGFLMLAGFWEPLMLTIYLVTGATILCVLIGIPIGIWAAHSPRAAHVTRGVCDTLQTFPSFIYLIPVIMLFQTSDVSNVIAMLAYATVPAIRFTYLGLLRVPAATMEAAVASGATNWQRLRKVELPIAFPEILLGINQTIMMALAMVAITALIGSRDLGQEIYKALPGADTGRGLIAGLGIAFIGITADRLIGAWAMQRKRQLGLA